MDLEFGNYRLKRAERLLLGPKGPVELSARSFDILAMLLERPDDVIGKTELFDVAWPGLVVEENTLQVHVSALRKALDPGMIMTVHGRGYKYAGPRPVAASSAAPVVDEASPPTKPSIAVLPFANLTGDPHQDFLCDGISQNITDDLARFHDLVVIASDSAFVHRNRNTSIQAMSQDLGARYLLQGSVVTSGNHLRIQARLVDGKSGQQVWSESYDGHPDSIFSLQDSVTKTIASTLATAYGGRLLKAWERRPDRAATRNMQAIDLFQRGMQRFSRFTKEDTETARRMFQEAAQLDPNYAKPLAKAAWTHIVDCYFGWSSNPETSLQASLELARKAVSTDPDESWSYWALSGYYQQEGDFERAIAGYEKALELNPNDADVVTDYGWCLSFAGRAEEGLAMAQRAMRLNPHHPDWYIFQFAQLQFNAKKYRDAVNTTKRLREVDTASAQLYLAASYAALGEVKNASMAVTRAIELDPQASIERYTSRDMAQYQVAADLDHFRDCLRKAGLPAASHHPTFEGKPIIVVLPFENLSGDAEQQYFSDGITGEIADRLARFRKFAVIGKHSSAAFRGAAPDFSAVHEKLKADFVVTGSVRRSEGRIRIALRLSDARSEEAIWAERYDRPVSELFSLQDEISELVAAAVPRQLDVEINFRNARRPPASLSSYEQMLQGYWHFRKLTRASNRIALQCFERAVALDPGNAEAFAWLGAAYCETWVEVFAEEYATKGSMLTAEAVAIDPFNAMSHAIHTWTLLCVGNLDAALDVSKRSMALNPGDPAVLVNRALALTYDGKGTEAHALLDLGRRLEPLPPLWFGEFASVLAFAEGRYMEALEGTEPLVEFAWDTMYALASCGHLGLVERAKTILSHFRQRGPDPDWMLGVSHEPFKDKGVRERLVAGLNTALAF